MSTPLFRVVSDTTTAGHRYVHVEPEDPQTFAARLAPLIKEHYFDEAAARAKLLRSANELALFSGASFNFNESAINAALNEERDAVLPAELDNNDKRAEHLSVQRSEFGEIVAAEVLKQIFGTTIPASRIKHKEIPDQPTRGADLVGLEDVTAKKHKLILGEVKASQQRKSPPGVVAGMVTKLTELIHSRRTLLQELCWLRDHAENEYAQICARVYASFILKQECFQIVIAPILVRSADTHHADDASDFKHNPQRFGKSVRWVSIVVEGDLSEVAREVYRLAREEAT